MAPLAQRRAYAAFLFDLAGENKLLGVPEVGKAAPGIQANSVAVLDRRLATRIAGEARALRLTECAKDPSARLQVGFGTGIYLFRDHRTAG